VTAGPTRERIDPVRFISNRSTGQMGYAIAERCLEKGLTVCLITGPVDLVPPVGAETIRVSTAAQMQSAVKKRIAGCDGIIMTAAVCDFRPETERPGKIKKEDTIEIRFVKNPDILKEIGTRRGLVKVGFALETDEAVKNARGKLKEKGLDLIVVNELKEGAEPFGDSVCDYTFVDTKGKEKVLKDMDKKAIANAIVEETENLLARGKP
jgi:phosphopantothenoylcysteine decarboxylase / phosphopantothenate---cysteine ligase